MARRSDVGGRARAAAQPLRAPLARCRPRDWSDPEVAPIFKMRMAVRTAYGCLEKVIVQFANITIYSTFCMNTALDVNSITITLLRRTILL